MKTYRCGNCGAEVLFNDGNFTDCIYCGSTITIDQKEYSELNIKKILPFNRTEEEAKKIVEGIMQINDSNKITKVDKYYIPVRFLNFDFSYYADYNYVVYTKENKDIMRRKIDIITGKVEKEVVIQTSKFRRVLGFHALHSDERKDFDPVLLDNVSCDFTIRDNTEDVTDLTNKYVLSFGQANLSAACPHGIYAINHDIDNLDIEPFNTLLPIYFIRTQNCSSIAVSGYRDSGKKSSGFVISPKIILSIIMSIIIAWMFYKINMKPFMIFGAAPFLLALFNGGHSKVTVKEHFKSKLFDNATYKITSDKYMEREFDYFL